jgi:fucose permease
MGHYNPVLWLGYGVYFIGAGIQTTFQRTTTHAYIVGILLLEGFGIGWTLQTALVASQALAPPKDRAVITGIRNLFRFTGGAFGLAISSAIMNNVINSKLADTDLPKNVTQQIKGAEFNIPPGLNQTQVQTLLDAEMEGVRGVFWFLLGVGAVTFVLSLGVEDHGLPGDEKKGLEEKGAQDLQEISEEQISEDNGNEENMEQNREETVEEQAGVQTETKQ